MHVTVAVVVVVRVRDDSVAILSAISAVAIGHRRIGRRDDHHAHPASKSTALTVPIQQVFAGAPDHPHRGFETVTYILNGEMEHLDSQGNTGRLGPGWVQWMTAG